VSPVDTTVACVTPLASVYAALTVAPAVDGIVFFSALPGTEQVSRAATIGKPCARSRLDDCQMKLNAFVNPSTAPRQMPVAGWPEQVPGQIQSNMAFAVVSSGDDLTEVRVLADLAPKIAPIESLAEAQAWAELNFKGATCEPGFNAKINADSYDLKALSRNCVFSPTGGNDIVTETIYRVFKDGRIVQLSSREVSSTPVPACAVAGRKPFAPSGSAAAASDAYGNFLSEMAFLEASAVLAFDELASDLERLGAPVDLVARARVAKADEARHAQAMNAHADRAGVKVAQAQAPAHRYASLLELALHNAEEGCVRETYGALVALHQAEKAQDVALRADMQTIAQEEVAHAQWSHDLAAWVEPLLSAAEREQVAAAKQKAFAALSAECKVDPASDLQTKAGLPSAETALRMLMGMKQKVLAS
jgi:hypothetical protein